MLQHLPPDEWVLAYVKRKNEQYADNVADSVAKLVLSFLKVATSKYDSIATLREYIQDTHKKEVLRFLALPEITRRCAHVCECGHSAAAIGRRRALQPREAGPAARADERVRRPPARAQPRPPDQRARARLGLG